MGIVKRIGELIRYSGLRSIYYNFRLLPFAQAKKLPLSISRNVKFRSLKGRIIIDSDVIHRAMIRFGFGDVSHIDSQYPRTNIDISGDIIFLGRARIGHGSSIRVEGKLIVGNDFGITARSTIIANREVSIGHNCLFSWDVLIMDSDYHKILSSEGVVINEPSEVVIGDNVWIGCRCTVLKGAVIGNNVIVGANSLVTKGGVFSNCVIAGQPARAVKHGTSWMV